MFQNGEGFSKLQEKIRGNCFIINQESFSNNSKVLIKILKEGFVSGNVMKMESVSTVTQFLQQVKPIEGKSSFKDKSSSNDEYLVRNTLWLIFNFCVICRLFQNSFYLSKSSGNRRTFYGRHGEFLEFELSCDSGHSNLVTCLPCGRSNLS